MTGIADWNMQFVRRDNTELRVAKLPPVLMPDRDHIQSAGWLWSVLYRVDHSRGSQKQNDHYQSGNDGPCQLNLHASIHLSWFTATVHCSPTEPNDGVKEQCEDRDKDDSSNNKYKDRQVSD